MIQRLINFLVKKTQNRKNIYIVPTAFGFIYTAITFSIFLIALTYTNNVTLIIAFWLLTVLLIQMLKTHKEVQKLKIENFQLNHSYQEESLHHSFSLSFVPKTTELKALINKDYIDLSKNQTIPRGVYQVSKIKIENSGSFGLFYCWKFYQTNKELVIYPKRVIYNLETLLNESHAHDHTSDDEFSLHIPYQKDMPAKRINWRIFAKNKQLYWKKFETHNYTPQVLTLKSVSGDLETKIQKLAFLVAHFNKTNIPWTLKLKGFTSDSSKGAEHLHLCLTQLAMQ